MISEDDSADVGSRSIAKRPFLKRGEGVANRLTAFQRPYRKAVEYSGKDQSPQRGAMPHGTPASASSMPGPTDDEPLWQANRGRATTDSVSPAQELLGETQLVGFGADEYRAPGAHPQQASHASMAMPTGLPDRPLLASCYHVQARKRACTRGA